MLSIATSGRLSVVLLNRESLQSSIYSIIFLAPQSYAGEGVIYMARNTGKGHRVGAIKKRCQTLNPKTGRWVKRDIKTGRFIASKSDGKPFKGVAKYHDDRRD